MRKIITFSAFILLSLSLFSQSPQFCPFGDSYEKVLTYLEGLGYLDEIYPSQAGGIIIVFDNINTYEYKFQDNRLYSIRLSQHYKSLKEAKKATKGGVEYLNILEGDLIKPVTIANYDHYVQIKEDKVVEVFLMDFKGNIQVNLFSTSRLFGPRSETEGMVFELTASNK